jgi:steroid delta-isomerase-like uncharacterized protein
MKHEEIKVVLADWIDAWRRRDAAALTAAFAEDAVYTSMLAGTIRGHQQIELLYRGWFTAFADTEFDVESQLIHRDQAAVLWTQRGSQTGELCGMAGSGRIFMITGVFFMTFRDGRIVNMRSIYDFTGLMLQIGILKAKPVE